MLALMQFGFIIHAGSSVRPGDQCSQRRDYLNDYIQTLNRLRGPRINTPPQRQPHSETGRWHLLKDRVVRLATS